VETGRQKEEPWWIVVLVLVLVLLHLPFFNLLN
jgi:hypothetical protein